MTPPFLPPKQVNLQQFGGKNCVSYAPVLGLVLAGVFHFLGVVGIYWKFVSSICHFQDLLVVFQYFPELCRLEIFTN